MLKTTLLAAAMTLSMAPHELPDMAIGTVMPKQDVQLKDVTGPDITLKDMVGANGILVVFSCNTCPFVIGSEGSAGWEGRYPGIATLCAKNKLGFVLVNSNEAKREAGDGFADMQQHYKEKGYVGHYVLDKNNALADAFGARTTPHVFLFDKDMKLAYKGAIDDNVDDAAAVKQHYVEDAIDALVAGRKIDPALTRNIGCSIKRQEHAD